MGNRDFVCGGEIKLMLNSNRIAWIDIARGLGMFLVMLGHRNNIISPAVTSWIYSFHMPLFFFLSGYVIRNVEKIYLQDIMQKLVKKLVVPFFCLGILLELWYYILACCYGGTKDISYYLCMFCDGVGTLWFVQCLFVAEILYYVVAKWCKGLFLHIVVLAIVAFGFFFNSLNYALPLHVEVALIALLFVHLGALCSKNEWWCTLQKDYIWMFVFGGGTILLNVLQSKPNMVCRVYGNPLIFVLGACFGILFVCCLSYHLSNSISWLKKVICFVGQNTLFYLAFHAGVGYLVLDSCLSKVSRRYGVNLLSGTWDGVMHVMAVTILFVPMILLINKFVPWMVGKGK